MLQLKICQIPKKSSLSLITKKSTISFFEHKQNGRRLSLCWKKLQKFDNKSKDDDCHHGDDDNNNNNIEAKHNVQTFDIAECQNTNTRRPNRKYC
jgi:hypothetical protein